MQVFTTDNSGDAVRGVLLLQLVFLPIPHTSFPLTNSVTHDIRMCNF